MASGAGGSAFARFGLFLARHYRPVLAVWAVVILASGLLVGRFEAALTGPPLEVRDSDSDRAQEIHLCIEHLICDMIDQTL